MLDEIIVQRYQEYTNAAGVQEEMPVENFINPIAEEEIIKSNVF